MRTQDLHSRVDTVVQALVKLPTNGQAHIVRKPFSSSPSGMRDKHHSHIQLFPATRLPRQNHPHLGSLNKQGKQPTICQLLFYCLWQLVIEWMSLAMYIWETINTTEYFYYDNHILPQARTTALPKQIQIQIRFPYLSIYPIHGYRPGINLYKIIGDIVQN